MNPTALVQSSRAVDANVLTTFDVMSLCAWSVILELTVAAPAVIVRVTRSR